MTRRWTALAALALVVPTLLAARTPARASSPIQHVVFLLQENHSFDNVLGAWCVQAQRCDGATTGQTKGGLTIPLPAATDMVPGMLHTRTAQTQAIDGGKMDGFNTIGNCGKPAYKCYQQFQPSQIPNLVSLATSYAVSDRTFELDSVPSWGAHLDVVSSTLDNFYGPANPVPGQSGGSGPGWGCDSGMDIGWSTSTGTIASVPSCVPDYSLNPTQFPFGGAYRATPVQSVPSIMDRLDAASLPWKLYVDPPHTSNYGWAMCPTFAGCLYTQQKQNMVSNNTFLTDASTGALGAFSVVTPTQANSQHNGDSMATGDNWLGTAVQAIENGPDWASTAIFIAYDDCGCFYDHVAPPANLGIRVPMVIVSPFARAGFTDSTAASFASVLAFTEHTFGLTALSSNDANAYDYSSAFNYAQTPRPLAFRAATTVISAAEQAQLAATPPDPTDPT